MKKVQDKTLILRLNAIYRAAQNGRPVYGIETQKKTWYFDEEYQVYALMRTVNGEAVMPVLFTVPRDSL